MSDAAELAKMASWTRASAAELMRQCSARRQAAECMQHATADELEEAAKLTVRSSTREVKAMTVRDARNSAKVNSKIGARLESEAKVLLAWADLLERIATSLTGGKNG